LKIKELDWKYLRKLSNFAGYNNKQLNFHNNLSFDDVNVFVGENGSGKSTIIDAIHSLIDSNKLKTLPRENPKDSVAPELSVTFDNNTVVDYKYWPVPCTKTRKSINGSFNIIKSIRIPNSPVIQQKGQFKKFNCTNSLSHLIHPDLNIFYFQSNRLYKINFTQDHVDELNMMADKLTGLSHQMCTHNETKVADCFYLNSKGEISATLDDDVHAYNHLDGHYLPSGWKSYITLVVELLNLADGTVCLIEEPENNLHPRLQRSLIKRIIEIARKQKLQLFITTHSATIINSCQGSSKLFLCSNNFIKRTSISKLLLDQLGCKASDVLQTNGIIWVEGPSDRIYLKSWLDAFAVLNNLPLLTENEDFQFSLYGGSSLKHFGSTNDLINIFRANPNSIVMMDNDNQYINKTFTCSTKGRVFQSFKGYKSGFCWVTDGYTIESYLTANFRKKYFKYQNSILKLDSSYSKAVIADKFTFNMTNSIQLLKSDYKLNRWVMRVYLHIKKWNIN
jgi:predicted ATPase